MVSAVTAVKGEKLQDLPFPNVASTLQGRASGVIVQNQGGEPGSEPKISIRGGGDPLYVIDGIITTDWEFKTLNSEDIESISILKDAASLAVYGSRAADGIVLVKTKEAVRGKDLLSTLSTHSIVSRPSYRKNWILIPMQTFKTRQQSPDGYGEYHQFSKEEMDAIRNQSDPYLYPNTDWYSLGLNNFARNTDILCL